MIDDPFIDGPVDQALRYIDRLAPEERLAYLNYLRAIVEECEIRMQARRESE